MKETALQQLLEVVKERYEDARRIQTIVAREAKDDMEVMYHAANIIELEVIMGLIEFKMLEERTQLEDAWQDGQNSVQCYGGSISHYFKDYYSKTYKTD